MTLADHFGDIIRKARDAVHLSTADAARVAHLSLAEYQTLESEGKLGPAFNLEALAVRLGLHAGKLRRIAEGWLPVAPELGRWRELRQITTHGAGLTVHCYLVWDEVIREAALFDTGFDANAIFRLIEENELHLTHLFLTHTHEDHVAALGSIRAKFPKLKLHSHSKHAPMHQRNRATDFIHLGSLRVTNRDTPGHAEDGVTYIVGNFPEDAPSIAIVGDALFAGSMGSAPTNAELAQQTIREQIFSLPADTLICPGHGPFTTVEQEKENNPFF